MDIVAGTDFLKFSLKGIINKWYLKKISIENKKVFQTRFEMIFDDHKVEIEGIFIDMLNEMKSELLNGEGGKEVEYFLGQIDKNLNGDILANVDDNIDKIEKNKGFKMLWTTFFYDAEMKQLFSDLNLNLNKYKGIIELEINNYFTSGKEVDLKLLQKEKSEVIKIVKFYIPKFEKLILDKIIKVSNMFLIGQIKPGVVMDNDKNIKMVKNIQKFSNDIKTGKMKGYYKRLFIVVDKIMDDMIGMLEK